MRGPVPVRAAVRRLAHYHPPQEGRAGLLRLDFNENTVGCSPKVRAAVSRMTREQVAIYPEYETARRRLARFFGVAPDELILTNGADEALRLVSDVFLERGGRALLVEPTFPMYAFYAVLAGARVVRLHYGADMRFPLAAACAELARGPRVFFLANPNNPTGTLVTPGDVQAVLEASRRTLVVVDEAYADFAESNCLELVRRCKRVLVSRTLSKSYALAGLRFGFLIAHPDIIRQLRKVKDSYNCDALSIAAATAAVEDQAWLRENRAKILATRKQLAEGLAGLGFNVLDSQANFVWCTHRERKARDLFWELKRRKILVRYMAYPQWGDGLRITVGTDAEIDALLRELKPLV